MKNKDEKRENSLPVYIAVKDFIVAFWKTTLIWFIIVIFILVALHYDVDKTLIGGVVVVFGLITQAFVGLIGIISLVPFIGPIIAKLLALPIFWLINALGYFASIVAIRKGYSRDVINYRILTIVLLVGVIIGFIIGRSVN
jgi:hypothetical protein